MYMLSPTQNWLSENAIIGNVSILKINVSLYVQVSLVACAQMVSALVKLLVESVALSFHKNVASAIAILRSNSSPKHIDVSLSKLIPPLIPIREITIVSIFTQPLSFLNVTITFPAVS